MTKARFYIKDKVQEVGYRVHIMQKILNSDLSGTVINLADGRVEVRLEGEKERIEEFYEDLKSGNNKPEHAEKPELYDLEFNAELMVPDSMRSSQALILEQLGKGIVYIAGMSERIDGMSERVGGMSERVGGMSERVGGMSERIDGMSNRIDGMSERIDGMSERIDGMSERIDGMSERIDGMNENITGMRVEMRDGFKSLPKEIAKELKDLLFIRR
jgi:acylphosphatase/archaellum component FlaC